VATADLLVIGGGIVGVTAALEAKRRDPGTRVVLVEKEDDVARHASGRNSGVLHAGLYYRPGGLKARLAREGNESLTRYCLERGVPIRRCGKLIVATRPEEDPVLDELLRRGRANGVEIHDVDAPAARALEPVARVSRRALWVPSTASVDPAAVTRALADDARAAGVQVRTGERFVAWRDGEVVTARRGGVGRERRGDRGGRGGASTEWWSAGYVLNAAGAYADVVARAFGFGDGYRIVPFKGRYLKATGPVPLARHIYPVPDLRYPFLGVHVSVAVDGSVIVGPTATPVLGREQYGVPVGPGEAAAGALRLGRLLGHPANAALRRLGLLELRRRSRTALLREAGALARDLPGPRHWTPGRPGIRAQLVDTRRWRLEDDFVYQADDRSLHVLNAVSPAFTCALPLARHLLDIVERTRGS
jgi:(S)-2-hydroxyglutarate dehydrogenase